MDRRSSDQFNDRKREMSFSSDILSQQSIRKRGKSADTRLNVASVTMDNVTERPSFRSGYKNYSTESSKSSGESSTLDSRLGLSTKGTFKKIIKKESYAAGTSNTTCSDILESESSTIATEKMLQLLKEQKKQSEKLYLKKTNELKELDTNFTSKMHKTQIVAQGLVRRSTFSEDVLPANTRFSSSISQKSSLMSEVKLPILKKSLEPVPAVKKSYTDAFRTVSFQTSVESRHKHSLPKISKSEIEEKEIGMISANEESKSNQSMVYFFRNLKKKLDMNEIEEYKTKNKKDPESKQQYLDTVLPEEDLEIKKYYRNLIIYCAFLSLITAIALSMVSSNMFYFTHITQNIFLDTPAFNGSTNENSTVTKKDWFKRKTLRQSNNFGDFWIFAESVLVEVLYWDFYNILLDPSKFISADERKMIYENQLLGVARMRQLRVRNDSCEIHPDMAKFFEDCFNYYSIFAEETRPIKYGMESSLTPTAWVYTESSKLLSSYYFGEISIYGGGGYYVDLGQTQDETKAIIAHLKENRWLGRPTRAVFIDFTLYNANVNLFLIGKLVFEFPPMGGMIPKADFHTLKLIRYLRPFDFFILGLEFLYFLFCIYYVIRMVKTISAFGLVFFSVFWNYIDLIILLLSLVYLLLGIFLYFEVKAMLAKVSEKENEYIEFQSLQMLQMAFNIIIALLIFAAWTKLFKFLNFNTIMLELKATLNKSLKDIFAFIPMFLTMFFTFALLGFLFFGNVVKDYHTVGAAMMALLQTFVGEFEYQQIQEANKIIGPVFFIAFLFFIIFISLNVFIAIINDAYMNVKTKYHYHQPKTGKYFKRAFLNIVGCSCCHLDKKLEKKPKIEKKIAYELMRRNLKKLGFNDIEIKIFFSKYDIDVKNALSEKVRKKIIEDLELKKINFSETADEFKINALRRRMDNLVDRIDEIEMNLKPVIDKVDIILHRKEIQKY